MNLLAGSATIRMLQKITQNMVSYGLMIRFWGLRMINNETKIFAGGELIAADRNGVN